jgi:leucyl aminopeptidase (aminopeptidase T)
MRVTSAAGTDILFTNEPGPVAAFRMRANPDHIPIMLAGQVSWTPIEASMTGRLVADGILSPPDEVGIIHQPITLDVAQGRITDIQGGHEARLLRRWLDQRADPTLLRIAHVSMGFNPGIRTPTGRILEDERAMGDIDFGFGAWVGRPAAGHFDFTCRQVTITADNVPLQRDGAFVHPSLITT